MSNIVIVCNEKDEKEVREMVDKMPNKEKYTYIIQVIKEKKETDEERLKHLASWD